MVAQTARAQGRREAADQARGAGTAPTLVRLLCLLRRCANAKQVLVAADEQLPLAGSRAAGGRFLQVVFRHHFKLFAGPNDGGDAAVGHKIGQAVGGDGTRAMAAAEAFHPVALAVTRIKAARDAGIGHN